MYKVIPARRTRGHDAIADVSPEVRAIRAETLAERERQMRLAAAEADVEQAKEALARAESASVERTALDAAIARLVAVKGETTGSKKKAA